MKFDAYQMATDRICELLEKGIRPWDKPWTSAMDCAWSGVTGKPYSFLNQWLLADLNSKTPEDMMNSMCGEWVTYEQAKKRGGHVKAGEKGRKVVFFTPFEIEENGEKKTIPYLTAYTVFKISQCEGIEQKFHTDSEEVYQYPLDADADSVANDYISREGVTYKPTKGNSAFYRPSEDLVVTPLMSQFKDRAEFYSTLFHELTHSTGHEKRLNRTMATAAFGNNDYSQEELVAEIGSASICATLGLESKNSFTNSAAYVQNWLKALKNDKKMIVKASAQAEKAVKMILNIKSENGGTENA